MSELDFQSELTGARAGDRGALDRLLVRFQPRLRTVTDKKLGAALRERVTPSDILQSSYLDVVRGIEGFSGASEDAFIAWIGQIIENNIRERRRYFDAKKRVRRADAKDRQAELDLETPSRVVGRLEDLVTVGRALDRIPAEYKDVILLRTVRELSHEAIAERQGRSVAAVKMLLSRARAALTLEIEALESGERPIRAETPRLKPR